MIKNILFRADSSSTIGTGHIMRDLVLASQYKDANIIFAVQDLDGNINHKIIEASYKIKILKSNDIKELNKLIKKENINLLVIDHYGIDYNCEKKLKQDNNELKILSFDDTYEKHYCDILLNHNISGDKKRYKNLVPNDCELRVGSKYTLLREEFIKEKNIKYKKNNKTKTIFIAMGGADSYNINIKILKLLKKISNIQANIVTTSANNNLYKLQKYCKDKEWISLHIDSNNIAKLMKKSDIGIVTPSVIVNEIVNMGIPFISIMVTKNQLDIYKFLKKNLFYVLKINNINLLSNYVKEILKDNKNQNKKIRKLLK